MQLDPGQQTSQPTHRIFSMILSHTTSECSISSSSTMIANVAQVYWTIELAVSNSIWNSGLSLYASLPRTTSD